MNKMDALNYLFQFPNYLFEIHVALTSRSRNLLGFR